MSLLDLLEVPLASDLRSLSRALWPAATAACRTPAPWMPPPMMTTSYSFMGCRKGAYAKDARIRSNTPPLRCRQSRTARGSGAVALLLESHHRCIRGHFDFPIDDGALGDRHRARRHLAVDHRGVADLQLVPDAQAAGDLAGDDGLLRLDESVPGAGGREV